MTAANTPLTEMSHRDQTQRYCFSVGKERYGTVCRGVRRESKNRRFGSEIEKVSTTHVQGHHELLQFQELSSVRLVGTQLLDNALQVVRLFLPWALTTKIECDFRTWKGKALASVQPKLGS